MPSSPPGLIIQRAGKRTERARLQASSRPIRAAGSRHARSLLASHARQGHVATSKGTSWARARRATRDFLARPAGGPHAKIGKRRAAQRHKVGCAGGCRRASAGHGNFHGHTHLKRPCTPSGGLSSRPCHDGCNVTFPNRSFGACTHTPLGIATRAEVGSGSPSEGGCMRMYNVYHRWRTLT